MDSCIGFVVVGVGRIGKQYVHLLKKGVKGAFLAGVCLADHEEGKRAAREFDCHCYFDPEAYLNDDRVAAIIVASPSDTHEEIAVKALKAGKHVIVEKPMALTLTGAQNIIRTAHEQGCKLMVSFPERFNPVYQKIKELVASGFLGDVISMTSKRRTKSNYRPTWYWQENRSGGVIWDLACHDVDLFRWILNKEIDSVSAMAKKAMNNKQVIDNAFISLDISGNTIGHIEASWMLPDNFPSWGDIQLEVLGTKGLIVSDTGKNQHINICAKGASTTFIHPTDYNYWSAVDITRDVILKDMLESFVNAVLGRAPLPITGEDGLRAVEVAAAASESIKLRRTIDII